MLKRPTTLEEAHRAACLLENKLTFSRKAQNQKPSYTRGAPSNTNINKDGKFSAPGGPMQVKRLTPQESRERRERGLCYHCDEKYVPGHRCKMQKIFVIEGVPFEEEGEGDWGFDNIELEGVNEKEPELSYHCMTGIEGVKSLRFVGKVGGKTVSILVDSGATHNFIDPKVVRRAGLVVSNQHQFSVKVADGVKIAGEGYCEAVRVEIQGLSIVTDLLIMPMGEPQVVLGTVWLMSLGPLLWDFRTRTLKFWKEGKSKLLKAASEKELDIVDCNMLDKMLHSKGHAYLLQLCSSDDSVDHGLGVNKEIQQLLTEFKGVFEEPRGLPPTRTFDHRIPLVDETKVANIRSYRHPFHQKNAIEKIVREMLEAGIIRPSSSPFAAPVVMVRKSDGSWRMCVDYRALNSNTIKDRFPIPLVDELLDELHGAKIFSKLDLRSGYHQIRAAVEDVHKTAFRTHEGHYKFLVMPFGLANAPSTFQGLMNQVFHEYLRKFILVFFDDILVYSHNWDEHIHHLQLS